MIDSGEQAVVGEYFQENKSVFVVAKPCQKAVANACITPAF
ncbi:hypothetical protein [Noviherbaspirillum malthae]|jgi:hypothetical protein|nr:hypothetical protein [Noviherbaspirillum malthae]